MNKNNWEKEFEERYCYENCNNELVIRWSLCQHPKELRKEILSFISNLLKKQKVSDFYDALECADKAMQETENRVRKKDYRI